MQNKKQVYIIGAGGAGREIESWFSLTYSDSLEWSLMGFLDDNMGALEGYPSNLKIVGRISEMEFSINDYVILSVADPVLKENIYNRLKGQVKFFTYVDKDVIEGKFIEIGEGSIICPKCIISTNVKLGKCVYINSGTNIGHDCKIGDFSSIMATVDLGGECILEEKVYMGTKSMIIPRRKIQSNILIGAGSIVIRNLKKAGTYFGSPAVLIS